MSPLNPNGSTVLKPDRTTAIQNIETNKVFSTGEEEEIWRILKMQRDERLQEVADATIAKVKTKTSCLFGNSIFL